MLRKFWKLLFDCLICKTPESWRFLRNFTVKRYILMAGKNLSIGRKCKIHKNVSIGNNSGVGYECEISNGVTIGNDVMMGPNVLIYTQNHNTNKTDIPMRTQGMAQIKPVTIEDDVWLGARVCILPGVTIGKGSVIGACAVVARDIPPYSVAVGNPAKIIKNRLQFKENSNG